MACVYIGNSISVRGIKLYERKNEVQIEFKTRAGMKASQ